jgi:putative colanic acid biosynthesis UDP-glucose lipid carrier transferase
MPAAWQRRTFGDHPLSMQRIAAQALEPAVALAAYVAISAAFGSPWGRADTLLCLGVLALTAPGRSRTGLPWRDAGLDILLGWAWRLAVLGLAARALDGLAAFNPRVIAAWALSTPAWQLAAVWALGRWQTRGRPQTQAHRSAVVIGAGPVAARLSRALREGADHADGHGRVRLLGHFDDRIDEPPRGRPMRPGRAADAARLDPQAARERLGSLADAAEWVRRHGVREVYITLPMGMQPRITELLTALQDSTASIYYVPDVFGITIVQGRLQDVGGVPVVGLCETPFTGLNAALKRAEDLVLGSLILVLIAPLMAAVALGVRLSSPGPVLFRQRRNGLDGREITVWKFRSMRTMEDGPVVRQATRDDPRITRFGAFIRRTSLDELPQFFNVLQGEMSIVGPRPHALAHNAEYRELIRAYMVRHKVKPGITGWAQVNGHRGETDTLDKMRARLECDLEYLRHWSLALDLRIIARTVGLVFLDRKAY